METENQYKNQLLDKLEQLYNCASKLPELSFVIDQEWRKQLKNIILSLGPDGEIIDGGEGGFHFFRHLIGYPPLTGPSIIAEDLDLQLRLIKEIAIKQNKMRDYKKTRGEIRSKQINQVLGSLFEIKILSTLIKARPDDIELYPKVGEGNSNVEARIKVDNRFIYLEAKAIGYSKYDPSIGIGTRTPDSMMKQIRDALNSKIGNNSQIQLIASSAPSVLCLSLGFHADFISGPWEINDFLSSDNSNVSHVFMADSVFCQNGMSSFPNNQSNKKLSEMECIFFESVFRTKDYNLSHKNLL